VSDVFRVGDVNVDIVADLGLELVELGAGDVDPPGVTRVPGNGFAGHAG